MQEKVDQGLLEQSCAELGLPCHLLYQMAVAVTSKGYRLRADIRSKLNNGAAAPLAILAADPEAVRRVAQRIDDASNKLLFALSPDDPVHGLYACAMFTLKLIDEGYLDDPTNMAATVSLMLMDDLKHEGESEGYRYKRILLQAEAGKLLHRCQKELGLYKALAGPQQLTGT